jgi:hypothetical protein
MALFKRTRPAPKVKGGSKGLRLVVRADFQCQCAYCLVPDVLHGERDSHEIDHHRPKKTFPELKKDFYNLYWSCRVCNNKKGNRWPSLEEQAEGRAFVDFTQDDFETHYRELPDGSWVALTAAAEYTLEWLRLNRDDLREIRRHEVFLRRLGWTPCSPLPPMPDER